MGLIIITYQLRNYLKSFEFCHVVKLIIMHKFDNVWSTQSA